MTPLLAAATLGVVTGAALQAATGFGFSMLAAPLMFAAVRPQPAVGLLLVLSLEMNVLTLGTERRRPRPLIRDSALLLGWALPGALAGVAVLRALSPIALQIAVTLGVVATLASRHLGRGLRVPAWAAGLAAGALTTSTSTAGPPLLVYLTGRRAGPAQVRDTVTVCFFGLGAIGAVALAATGSFKLPAAWLVTALVPAVVAGHLAGRRAFARLAESDAYERVLTGLLMVAVLTGLVGALA